MNEIITGVKNHLLGELGVLDGKVKALAKSRLDICHTCDMRTEERCSSDKFGVNEKHQLYKGKFREKGKYFRGCGCNIILKSKSPDSRCPLGKW